jgi:hypothetical protein
MRCCCCLLSMCVCVCVCLFWLTNKEEWKEKKETERERELIRRRIWWASLALQPRLHLLLQSSVADWLTDRQKQQQPAKVYWRVKFAQIIRSKEEEEEEEEEEEGIRLLLFHLPSFFLILWLIAHSAPALNSTATDSHCHIAAQHWETTAAI